MVADAAPQPLFFRVPIEEVVSHSLESHLPPSFPMSYLLFLPVISQ